MKTKFFSVVTSVYNGQEFIERAIRSVMSQDCNDFEYIVVDNGSTDATPLILNRLLKEYRDKDLKIISLKENRGISGGRNTGIAETSGKYICFLDADDYWYPNKLSEVKKILEIDNSIDVVCHWEEHIEGESKKIGRYREISSNNPYEDLLFKGNCLSTSATTVNADLMKLINGFDLKLISGEEDYDCWLRLAKSGAKFYSLKKPLGVWIIRKDSISNKHLVHLDAVLKVINSHYKGYVSEKYDAKRIEIFRKKSNARLLCSYGKMISDSGQRDVGDSLYKRALKLYPYNIKAFVGLLLNVIKNKE